MMGYYITCIGVRIQNTPKSFTQCLCITLAAMVVVLNCRSMKKIPYVCVFCNRSAVENRTSTAMVLFALDISVLLFRNHTKYSIQRRNVLSWVFKLGSL